MGAGGGVLGELSRVPKTQAKYPPAENFQLFLALDINDALEKSLGTSVKRQDFQCLNWRNQPPLSGKEGFEKV